MPLCDPHQRGEMPRWLQYASCDACAKTHLYRKRSAASRRATETRRKRTGPAWHWDAHDKMLAQEEFWSRVRGLPIARRILDRQTAVGF